ncbi:MAG: NAD(P)H-binding protein [Balneola sp.]|nr:NAD(P)H-binding protein [Balneola sp.]MBO6650572.1 NAD(P)H-binding protein [Balneola sp.]MBO6712649.1 NAD(P)H-binding protein [Balneola sp.]MBO6800857.1 NAD(P)H-binding protein [Balneola sp.]MBO6870530.1 NAD(P)H-binding protein [Balneola sp.]
MDKKAILIGATGLVGSHILQLLLADDRYESVKVFHRRSTEVSHSKLTEHIIDFDDQESWKSLVSGDHLFSALGTTIKKAGSKDEQYKIDFTYQFEIAKAASVNNVSGYALVSSLGANSDSGSFYPRIKGELDEAVQNLAFENSLIIRPSFLDGDRDEFRLGERIGIAVAKVVCKIPGLKKYHPIKAESVAKAMIEGLNSKQGKHIFEAQEILSLDI